MENICINKNYNLVHKCCTEQGSSGSPILNLNNKVIGIHKEGVLKFKYNNGTFLNYPIKEFIKLNYKNNNINNDKINNDVNKSKLLLTEFNNKYNLNIKDEKIIELDLKFKNLKDMGLKDLL